MIDPAIAYIDKNYHKYNWDRWFMGGINPSTNRHQVCVDKFCVDAEDLYKIHLKHLSKKKK